MEPLTTIGCTLKEHVAGDENVRNWICVVLVPDRRHEYRKYRVESGERSAAQQRMAADGGGRSGLLSSFHQDAGRDGALPTSRGLPYGTQILQDCALGFTYPPFFAFIMLPFAAMPLWVRELIWYAVTLAAVTGSFELAEFVARKGIGAPLNTTMVWSLRTLALLLSAKGILAVFENQAYDALVILFVLLGLAALVTGRDVGAGASLALAAALKTTPLIFLPYLLYKRYFAAAGAFVLVYLTMSCLPDVIFAPTGAAHGYFITWLQEIAGPSLGLNPANAKLSFWHGANILNHSLRGAVALNIDETSQHTLFDASLGATDAAFIIVVAVLIALSPRRTQSIALDGSLLVIAMLMLSPMTSRSHYVALLLPYMTLLAANLHDQRTTNLGRFILTMSFMLVTLSGNDLVGQTITVWAYEHSAMVLGVLVLLLYVAPLVVELDQQNTIPNRFTQPQMRP